MMLGVAESSELTKTTARQTNSQIVFETQRRLKYTKETEVHDQTAAAHTILNNQQAS